MKCEWKAGMGKGGGERRADTDSERRNVALPGDTCRPSCCIWIKRTGGGAHFTSQIEG